MNGLVRPDRTEAAVTVAGVALLLAAGMATTLSRPAQGSLVVAWMAGWAVAAGVLGWQRRSWRWPALCPFLILALVLLWELSFGRSSWASTFVLWLGILFTLAATAGALAGTWLGRRVRR